MSADAEEPNEEPQEAPPFIIEAARSSRSKCKSCNRKIDAGVLRLGVLVEGRFGPGHMWHHLKCAGKRMIDQVEEAYEIAAWELAKVPVDPSDLPDLESLRELAAKEEVLKEKREKERKVIPYAEIAPSNRSKCKQSGEPIPLGSVRIVLGMEARFGNQVRVSPFAVLPRHVEDALLDPEMGTEEDGLADLLRENSDIDPELLEQAIAEAGL